MKRSGTVQITMQRNIDYYESLSVELNFNTFTVFFSQTLICTEEQKEFEKKHCEGIKIEIDAQVLIIFDIPLHHTMM